MKKLILVVLLIVVVLAWSYELLTHELKRIRHCMSASYNTEKAKYKVKTARG
jgi:hypothetical protein